MTHPLILQLRFTRSEFMRGVAGLSAEDAMKRVEPMNSIGWNVGHLAWQEQRYFLQRMQDKDKAQRPELNKLFCYGCPAITPPLDEMLQTWQQITQATDSFLDTLTTEDLVKERVFSTREGDFITNWGNLVQRVIYHYWYHNGENQAIRQVLRNTGLQDFVGDIDTEAPYKG